MAEKTFQTYFFTTHNPGGHSSRPRPDNAIYDLADALEEAAGAPLQADAERHHAAAISRSARRQEGNSPLGQAIRALARQSQRRRRRRRDRGQPARGRPDPHALRRDDAEGGPCRQCAAAEREGDGQLPDHARGPAEGRCRPSSSSWPGPKVEVTPDPELHRRADAGLAASARCAEGGDRSDPALPRPGDARLPGDVDRRQRRQLLPRPGHPGLRRRRQLGHLARRRARPRPRRAHPGARDVRRRAPLGDDVARRWPG